MRSELVQEANRAFSESGRDPGISLRAGNARDDGSPAPAYDAVKDDPTDAYLEANWWGIAHLDSSSWKHYVPRLVAYSLDHIAAPDATAVDAFVESLRPPDREPPRLGSLTPPQREVLTKFLDALAFSQDSAWKKGALIALEEYWAPGALYGSTSSADGPGANGA